MSAEALGVTALSKDGYINRDEAAKLRNFGKAFDEADDNHDGKMDRDEFVKAQAIYDRMRAEAYIDDSVITAKVKAAFVKDPDVKVLEVSVKTDKGLGQEKIVTLIAWRLETAMTKSHARGLGWDVRPLRLLSSGR